MLFCLFFLKLFCFYFCLVLCRNKVSLIAYAETITTHEFAGLLLSYMASDFSSKVLIAQSDGLSPLVACLAESDPDVQKNALDTIALMLQDSEARTAIRAPASAGIEPILNLTQSEFPVIQQVALNSLALIAQEGASRLYEHLLVS